jgi:transcriptional regulator GlxA family with amidase domain
VNQQRASAGRGFVPAHHQREAPARVAILAPSGVRMLNVVGPYDVFASANRLHAGRAIYRLEIVSTTTGWITGTSGLRLAADRSVADGDETIDTLLVAGPREPTQALADATAIAWVMRLGSSIRRCAAVCTGGFILAAAGLLDGRRATTHWRHAREFAERFPAIEVQADHIFVRDGSLWTSAGVTAGIDLALALVEEDHGRALALAVARDLVVFLKRPGGQSQFSLHLAAQITRESPIQKVQAWVLDHLSSDLSTLSLAKRAGMSVRNFGRVFRQEALTTPARFVEAARVDAARRMLEETRLPLKRIAADSGFGTIERMRRAFRNHLATSPPEYRRRFRSTEGNG